MIRFKILFSTLFSCLLFSSATVATPDPMASLSSLTKKLSDTTGGRLNVSGYINGHLMRHDGTPNLVGKDLNATLFQIREASIFVDFSISESVTFSTELEMSYDFSDKNDSGRDDAFESLLNYYYLDVDISNAMNWDTDESGNLKLRFGRILVPFLHYNENKPNFKQSLMSQPFTAWQLAPVNNVAGSFQQFGWTDAGLSINWSYIIEDQGLFDLKFSVINGLGSESGVLDSNSIQLDPGGMMKPTVRPRDGLVNARSDWDELSDVNSDKALVLKLSYVPFSLPLNLGISWYDGAWDADEVNNLSMRGFHANYLSQDWAFKAEYLVADVEQTAGINIVTAPGPAMLNASTGDYQMSAWYLEGAYTAYRYGNDYFVKLILRLDAVDTNDEAKFTPFDRSRYTLGVEWEFIRNIRMRMEYQKSKIDNFDNAPAPFIAAGGQEEIQMTMLSLIVYF